MRLDNLSRLLARYAEEEGGELVLRAREGAVRSFQKLSTSTPAGATLQIATEFPAFFRVCALLFPRKVSAMVGPGDGGGEDGGNGCWRRLAGMDKLAREQPWKLGFSEVGEWEVIFVECSSNFGLAKC